MQIGQTIDQKLPPQIYGKTKLSQEDFASYKTEIHVEGDTVNYKRIFKLNEGSYAVDAYEAYRDFYKNVVREDNQKLFIEKL